jgi:hypothetical protein
MSQSLSQEEEMLINRFKDLDDSEKVLLADYSYRLYCNYPDRWNEWIHRPVTEQVITAGAGTGGIS